MTNRTTIVVLMLSASLIFFSCDKKGTEPDPAPKVDYQYPMYVLAYENNLDKSMIYKISVPDGIVLDSVVLDFTTSSMQLTSDEEHLLLTAGWWTDSQSWLISVEDYSVVATGEWRGPALMDQSRGIGLRSWANGLYSFDLSTLMLLDSVLIPEPDLTIDTAAGMAYVSSTGKGYESMIIVVDYVSMAVVDTLLISNDPVDLYNLLIDVEREQIMFQPGICGEIWTYDLNTDSLLPSVSLSGCFESFLLNEVQNLIWVYGNVRDYNEPGRFLGFLYAFDADTWEISFEYQAYGLDSLGFGKHSISGIAKTADGKSVYVSCGPDKPGVLKVNRKSKTIEKIDLQFQALAVEIGTEPLLQIVQQ